VEISIKIGINFQNFSGGNFRTYNCRWLPRCQSVKFYKTITQGSEATYFRCGGIFNDHFIANLPLSIAVRKF